MMEHRVEMIRVLFAVLVALATASSTNAVSTMDSVGMRRVSYDFIVVVPLTAIQRSRMMASLRQDVVKSVEFQSPPPLVDLTVRDAVIFPPIADDGEATVTVSVLSDHEAVVVYEIGDITVYDELSFIESALAVTNLTLAEVNVTGSVAFTVQGMIVVADDYDADVLREDVAFDLDVDVDSVTITADAMLERQKSRDADY